MSDDTPDQSATDARDERLAEALAVPPLDEVTRRRLVSTALERGERATSRPRYAAIVSVAAAVVVGGLIGWLLVRQPRESSTTTAQRAPSGSQALSPSSSVASNNAAQPAAGAAAGPITALGELGDITDPNRLRTQLRAGFAKSSGPEDPSLLTAIPCESTSPRSVDLVAVSAIGTGTYRGYPVTVLVGTAPEGSSPTLAVIVRPPGCELVASVPLPSS